MIRDGIPASARHFSITRTMGLLLLVWVFATTPETRDEPARNAATLHCFWRSAAWQTGDLIFRRGLSLSSQAVLLSETNADYSHVGFVYVIHGRPYVIHAVPGESGGMPEKVRCEPIRTFLSGEKASRAGLFRVTGLPAEAAEKAGRWAVATFLRGALFDDAYDIRSDTKLYCTELIWKCYRAAGIDLVGGKFDHLAVPTMPSLIILPETLIHHPSVIKIISY